ncbi:MAG TPA: succinate dehydrogenase, cytochrome b556 subunit [Dongiaceae bacterium]
MTSHPRPISPHLQIYKPQLTSVTSILHRISGVVLSLGTLALVYWLIAAALGQSSFDTAEALAGSWLGRLALFGWTLAFFFHLLNGIRHLAWDAGKGFDLPSAYRSGWAAIIGTVILTLIAWILAYIARGVL